jgi:uncharacterized protein YqjF (DUF2071 family)
MHPALAETAHRPWPLPATPWVLRMKWHDLLFAHWAVPAAQLRPLVPSALELEEFDGSAWLGVVPFLMTGTMLRGLPDVPSFSDFPEINVRTYVRFGDKPGVWFFSLDADNRLAVLAARFWTGLPYFTARISMRRGEERVDYYTQRLDSPRGLVFDASYAATSQPAPAPRGSIEEWFTERYCLYTVDDGRVNRLEIHHPPWQLERATMELRQNDLVSPLGFRVDDRPSHLHFSRVQDVVAWSPSRVRA